MPRKRELIEPHEGDKRYIRRDAAGKFTEEQDDVGRSLAADRRSKSKTVAPKGRATREIRSAPSADAAKGDACRPERSEGPAVALSS
jgi:hypothetical protein